MNEPSRFLSTCRGDDSDAVPVWFMRQAGRSLPEYRLIRERYSLLEICDEPEVAAEVTLQPVRRLGVDAAILFSDIVVPLRGAGVDLDVKEGVGPVIFDPIRTSADVASLRMLEPETDVPQVLQTVRLLAAELDVPLIGFAGAPFTLACYLIDGGPSKDHARAKSFMFTEHAAWGTLMDTLTESAIAYLRAQVGAGASAVQLFDSWAGWLAPDDYRRYSKPWVERIFAALSDLDIPRIGFGVNTGELLVDMAETGCDVLGVDHRVRLADARERVGYELVLQGNLDPIACLSSWEVISAKANDALSQLGGRRHIFNLGHGVHPETDPEMLARLVDLVHGWEPRG